MKKRQCHKYIKRYDETDLFSNEYAANGISGYQCTKMEDTDVPEDIGSVSDFHTDIENIECSSSKDNAYKTLKDMNLSDNQKVVLSKEVVEIKFDRKEKNKKVVEKDKVYSIYSKITIDNIVFKYSGKFNNGYFSVVPYYVNEEQNIHIAVKYIYHDKEEQYPQEKHIYSDMKDIIDIKMIFVDKHNIVIMDKYNMNLFEFMSKIKPTNNIINYLKKQLIKILEKAYSKSILNSDIKLENILVICNKNEFKVTFGDVNSFYKPDNLDFASDNKKIYIYNPINKMFENYEEKNNTIDHNITQISENKTQVYVIL